MTNQSSQQENLSFLLLDDHAIVRQGIKQLIAQEFPTAAFDEAGNAEAAIELLARPWSLMIADIGLPGRNGLEVLKEAHHRYPHMPVLILSMYPERQYAIRALRSGAAGYLMKEAALAELVTAVHRVLAGRKYISAGIASQLAGMGTGGEALHERLSTREQQIIEALVSGKALSEIASQMHVSVQTVWTYKKRAMKKLHAHTDVELIRYAVDHQLIIGPIVRVLTVVISRSVLSEKSDERTA